MGRFIVCLLSLALTHVVSGQTLTKFKRINSQLVPTHSMINDKIDIEEEGISDYEVACASLCVKHFGSEA